MLDNLDLWLLTAAPTLVLAAFVYLLWALFDRIDRIESAISLLAKVHQMMVRLLTVDQVPDAEPSLEDEVVEATGDHHDR